MVTATLQRHLHTKRVDRKDKPIELCKRKCDELKHSKTNLTSVIKGENVCESLHKVSCRIARCGG
jgi:hypothetical protein